MLKSFNPLFIFLFCAVLLSSCSDDDDMPTIQVPATVVDVATNNNFTQLAAALNATNLTGVLQGDGPFTVFAPTNDAFQAVLDSNASWNTVDDIPQATLTKVLLNHVVSGSNLASATLTANPGYTSVEATGTGSNNLSLYYNLNGNTLELNGGDGTTSAPRNGADVTTADLFAQNGVVHVINKVMFLPTVVDHAIANPNFTTLVQALTTETPTTDFVSILSDTDEATGNAPFTVFAPTNDGFQDLLDSNMNWDTLADVAAAVNLPAVLQHHVLVNANVRSSGLTPNGVTSPMTLQGQTIDITLPGTNGNIAGGSGNMGGGIIAVDVQADNGVIHVLDTVLLPN